MKDKKIMEKHTIGTKTVSEKDEYNNGNYFVTDIDLNPITLKEQNKLKQIFDILEISIPTLFFGHTKISIETKELNSDNVYKLFKKSEEVKQETMQSEARHSSQA